MKKIFYVLISLTLSLFTIQSANAGLPTNVMVVLGMLESGPAPAEYGPVVTGVPKEYGPVVTNNKGTVGGKFGTYAIVNSVGTVTNIIVCGLFCSNGTFTPGGDIVVLQSEGSEGGFWFGPNTTTYDQKTNTFTAVNPNPEQVTNTGGNSSATVLGNKTYTFSGGNLFIDQVTQSWSSDSVANVSVIENNNLNSLSLGTTKTTEEIKLIIDNSGLPLLISKTEELIVLLENWVK
jgi:hypothetical protein